MADDETPVKSSSEETKVQIEEPKAEAGNQNLLQRLKQPIREELVNTAVHFLQNPKVQSSSLVQKRAFLIKKGLTSEEVDVAIERSGFSQLQKYRGETSHPGPHQTAPQVIIPSQPPQNVPLPVMQSIWTKIYNLMSFAVTLGGVCYGAILIYKRYIEPWLMGTTHANTANASVENHLLELNDSILQLQQSLQDVQTALKKQQEVLNEIVCPDFRNRDLVNKVPSPTEASLAELKAEVATIKSLLLSRRQFPTSPLTNPTIPSWQLVNGDSTDEGTSEKMNGVEEMQEDDLTDQQPHKEALKETIDSAVNGDSEC